MQKLKDLIGGDDLVVAPVVFNPIMARMAEEAGFKAVYLSGGTLGWVKCVTEANLTRDQIRPEGWLPPATWAKPIPQKVRNAMTGVPVGMSPESDLADVVSLMLEANFRSIPVVDDGDLVGIVSRRDVLRVVA